MKKKLLLSSLFLFFCLAQSIAQQRTITGTVLSKDGTPLSNASVVILGQRTGETTGLDGKFSIKVPSNAKELYYQLRGL